MSDHPLRRFERRVYSQCGEDGVIARLVSLLPGIPETAVEFGAGDGVECNTRYLSVQGWISARFDLRAAPDVIQARVTPGNAITLIERMGLRLDELGLLSVDLDGPDYHVLKATLDGGARPWVVVVEYNANFGGEVEQTVPYDPTFRWTGSSYYGATWAAMARLLAESGWVPTYTESAGVNLFAVRADLWRPEMGLATFRPQRRGVDPPDPRPWLPTGGA